MKFHHTLLLFLALPLFSCVTSGDFQRIADSLGELERVVDDETKTTAEVQAQIQETQAEVASVAEAVETRTDGVLDGLTLAETATGGGLVSLLTGIGLNMYRDSRRRRRGEPVEAAPAPPRAG